MKEALLLLIMGTANVLCLFIGAKIAQMAEKGEDIKLPTINPMEIAREQQDKKQAQKEQERIDTVMQNIEAYDGTGKGQKDVPGR